MNNFLVTVGLEIHCELNTKTKMFSNAPNNIYGRANSCINEVDLGLPGSLPTVNKQGVAKAITLAKALNMTIDKTMVFDRKNYLYHDLPKGFQITQFYHPIGQNGFLVANGKEFKINRIHIEEDTAKQTINGESVALDFNRCGVPLIEIVSEPVFHSSYEVKDFLVELWRTLIFLNISHGRLEDGGFRVDVNVSVAPIGSQKLGTRVEIKNINSFNSVVLAIEAEKQRQIRELFNGQTIKLQTRRWDEAKNTTIFMRSKENEVDYRYFTEPNIAPIDITTLCEQVVLPKEKLPWVIRQTLLEQSVDKNIIDVLLNNFYCYQIYSYIDKTIKHPPTVITWVVVELLGYLNKNNRSIESWTMQDSDRLIDLINHINQQKINNKQAKTIFPYMIENNLSVTQAIEKLGFVQITDEAEITKLLSEIIASNQPMLEQYSTRPERVEKFFIGLLMQRTKGQANPNISMKVLQQLLKQQ